MLLSINKNIEHQSEKELHVKNMHLKKEQFKCMFFTCVVPFQIVNFHLFSKFSYSPQQMYAVVVETLPGK